MEIVKYDSQTLINFYIEKKQKSEKSAFSKKRKSEICFIQIFFSDL